MRVYLKTLGCKVNRVESDDLSVRMAALGHQLVDSPRQAQTAIVNTCTVTAVADAKCRKEIRRLARLDTMSAVYVIGCGARLDFERYQKLSRKVHLGIPKDLSCPKTPASSSAQGFTSASLSTSALTLPPASAAARIRVPVKVQDGCDAFCSYCIVPYARGAPRSAAADELVSRVAALADAGTKEVILTGINVGRYVDTRTGIDLSGLITRLGRDTALHRVRLSSIEPLQITDALLELLADGKLLCNHLHVPLQSGNDATLAAMKRAYTTDDYRRLISDIRRADPHTAITTDLMVGFPTETEDDFNDSLSFVREMKFARIHLFRYSPRPSTAAAQAFRPLEPRILARRSAMVQDVAGMDALAYQQSLLGRRVELVIESTDPDNHTVTGMTREYLRVTIPDPVGVLKPGDLSTQTLQFAMISSR